MLKDLFLAYIRAYAARDLAAISAMFAETITLRDWNLAVHGKTAALAETAKNFAAAETIAIQPLALYEHADTVAGELHIVVDNTTELYVVDVITFNTEGLITAIRAYIGRGDG